MFSDNKICQLSQDHNKERFSDLEILEINQKINYEQDSNTTSDTPRINKQKQSKRNELKTSENRNSTQPNNREKTLAQEQKVNLENLKRIMNWEKIILQSLIT